MNRDELIVFDLDDTLIDTSSVYYRARTAFVTLLESQGVKPYVSESVFEAIDGENIVIHGFSPERYAISMKQALNVLLDPNISAQVRETLISQVDDYGQSILHTMPDLLPYAKNLLEWASHQFQLALLTRGVEELQRQKLLSSGLTQYFSYIKVVPTKNVYDFLLVMDEIGYTPQQTWVVGDSVKSDINPGLLAGARCIWYLYKHPMYIWLQEHTEQPIRETHVAENLVQVQQILSERRSKPGEND